MALRDTTEKVGMGRVLIVTTSYPLTKSTASGVFVRDLVNAIADRDAEVYVVCPDNDCSIQTDAFVHPVRYAVCRHWQTLTHGPGGMPVAIRNNRWQLLSLSILLLRMGWAVFRRKNYTDVILANWSLAGLIAVPSAISGKPLFTILRGSDMHGGGFLKRLALRVVIWGSQKVVCVSSPMKEMLINWFPSKRDKIVCIPNGVDRRFSEVAQTRSYRSDSNSRLRLIYVGNVVASKRVDVLVNALAKIKHSQSIDAHLEIFGDGDVVGEINDLICSLNLNDRVALRGAVGRIDIIEALRSSDIFVFASELEGRPNAVVEAMATGLPCICANIPPLADLVISGEDGLLFAPGESTELASYIMQLANCPNIAEKLGRSGAKKILESGFSWNGAAMKYEELILACKKTHIY